MEIIVNGKKTLIVEETTLLGYITSIGLNPALIVCELNLEIPLKENWDEIVLQHGDQLELVKFIGGG